MLWIFEPDGHCLSDYVFGHLDGVLKPRGFDHLKSSQLMPRRLFCFTHRFGLF